jgi:hypothetical protein
MFNRGEIREVVSKSIKFSAGNPEPESALSKLIGS